MLRLGSEENAHYVLMLDCCPCFLNFINKDLSIGGSVRSFFTHDFRLVPGSFFGSAG